MEFTAKELIELTKEIDQKCIDFAEWMDKNVNGKTYNDYKKGIITTKELLEMYKKKDYEAIR